MSCRRLVAWAPLPLLLLAAFGGEFDLAVPDLFFGARFGLDALGRVFLAALALLWLAAAQYAADKLATPRFLAPFALTAAGSLVMPMALDGASFYLASALLGFGAYGLVVHERTAEALHAGRIYIALAVLGEALLLEGLVHVAYAVPGALVFGSAAAAAIDPPDAGLVFAGLGIKAALPFVHGWLPLVGRAAPPPAAAVVAGAAGAAGVLGWLRFLPLGSGGAPEFALVIVGVGLAAACLGPLVGLLQADAPAAIGYWCVGQTGFITVAVGAALGAPPMWAPLAGGVPLLAAGQALATGALFLAADALPAGRAARRLALGALALVAAPLGAGLLASVVAALAVPAGVPLLLALALVALTALCGRIVYLLGRRPASPPGRRRRAAAWGLPVPALLAPVAAYVDLSARGEVALLGASLCLGVGAALATAVAALPAWRRRVAPLVGRIPAGDLVALLAPLAAAAGRRLLGLAAMPERWRPPAIAGRRRWGRRLLEGDARLRGGLMAGLALVLLIAVLVLA